MADGLYEKAKERSLLLDELVQIVAVMRHATKLPHYPEGSLVLRDENGDFLADIWWDAESEMWLADLEKRDE